MQELKQIINQIGTELDDLGGEKSDSGPERIRQLARQALRRTDLRITAEMLFMDFSSHFSSYNSLDDEGRGEVLGEAREKINRLRSLAGDEELIKEGAIELPPPPDCVAEQIAKDQKKIDEIERREKEERERIKQEKQQIEREKRTAERAKREKERPAPKPRPERKPRAAAKADRPRAAREERKRPPREKTAPPSRSNSRPDPQPEEKPIEGGVDSPVATVPGIGSVLARRLNDRNIDTVYDLLTLLPRDYEDRRRVCTLKELVAGTWCTSIATVDRVAIKHPGGRGRVVEIAVSDETGTAACKFFGGRVGAIKSGFPVGEKVVISGEIEDYKGVLEFHHPDTQKVPENGKPIGQIVPVYSESEGLSRRRIRGLIRGALDSHGSKVPEYLPEPVRKARNLPGLLEALESIHFPPSDADLDLLKIQATDGHRRLVFDELFLLQLGVQFRKMRRSGQSGIGFTGFEPVVEKAKEALGFKLTGAQQRVLEEILGDMKKADPMRRLLQGDVGCGKTAVALLASTAAMAGKYQVALMAPTEVLAEQHASKLIPILEKLGFPAALLTGGLPADEANRVRKGLAEGSIAMAIGTHALIQQSTSFKNLGLAIIDEQHRFGVAQRRELASKGKQPDVLTMTATPIPRSLAMTVYGDLDISRIDEMPPGRKGVATEIFSSKDREKVLAMVAKGLKAGQQAFAVYPVIEDGASDLKAAVAEAENHAKKVFANFRVALLHGRMRSAEKEKVVKAFSAGELDLLVSTTVIEVGIDIPNAAVMLIEHAERFGLAQLHQLRGRVGRGDAPGQCLLIVDEDAREALDRVKLLKKINDGFELAEKDLELRGMGQLFGFRQHGLPGLKIADLARDTKMMEAAVQEAQNLLRADPKLNKPDHVSALDALRRWWGQDSGI
jgi:ATP-dependent DNA helicase RecG